MAKQVAASFSNKLHTKVTVKKIDFAFFNKLSIEGVMVQDRNADTLLYAGAARVNITDWFFFKDKITLHYVSLEDAIVNMQRSDSVWNYQFLVDYFSSPKKSTATSGGLEFDLKELHLSNTRFNKIDRWIGQNMVASIKKADIKIDGIDYKNKKVLINDMYLEEPVFALADYIGKKPVEANLKNILEKIPGVSALKWNNSGWIVTLKKLQLYNGSFLNDKETTRPAYTDRFDGQHLLFSSISGNIDDVVFKDDTLKANILLTAKEKSGLYVKKLQSFMRFTPERMEFNNLDLETNNSRIGNYYSMHYNTFNDDMSNFMKSVTLEARLHESKISSDDLAIFAPQLADWKRVFYVEGNAKGTIENFSAKKMKVRSGNTIVDGDIAMRGLPDINTTFIDFKGNSLQTNYADLVAIIPALKHVTQPQLSKLGNIYYKGNFTGFLNDFVTYGTIVTNLGVITADLNMKLPENAVPSYSGKLVTNGFKLGQFLNNPELGSLSLNGKVVGSGFVLNKLNANFDGSIRQIEFNGYDYQNLVIKGDFNKNLFTGHLTIDDPNIKIKNLDGTLSLSGKEIDFNLDADLEYANLKNIHFTKENFELKGLFSLNFTGNNIDNFLGTARVYDASFKHDSTSLSFDSLNLTSFIKDDIKFLTLKSNEIDAELSGKFTIMELPDAFKVFLSRYYPVYIKKPSYTVSNQDFSFNIKTKQVSEYLKLFDKKLNGLNNASITGNLNLANYGLNVSATVPEFEYDGKKFNNIILKGNGNRDTLKADIAVDDVIFSDSLHFPGTKLQLTANNDVSVIHLKTSAGKTLNDAELNASIQTLSDGVKVHFFPSSFIINDKKWELEKDGELTVRRKYIDANEIKFIHDKQQIVISTELSKETNETHIVAKLQQVDIGDFMPFVITKPSMKGFVTGTATVRDPFGKFGIDFKGTVDSFSQDNKYVGKINVEATANTVSGEVKFKADANEGEFVFNVDGKYNYKDSSENQMNINLYAGRLNMNILEPYLGSIFSKMDGIVHSELKLYGGAGHRYLTGQATIDSGSLKVAYTQCKYFFTNETVTFKKDEIDLGSMKIKDTLNNEGNVSGKMYHQFFNNFSFDNIRFETGKLLLLSTTKKDNSQFYGNVTGSATMTLNGPVTNMVMNINAQPSFLDSSHIYLPTGSSKESNAVDYIEFIQFGSLMEDSLKANESSNIVVNMNLTANPACKIDVILDEETGDIIKGQGSGSLNIRVGNREPISIRGKYDITEGEYTFNFQTFLKKPFTLSRGSITWNGDPALAIIDIEARYLAKDVDITSLNPVSNINSTSAAKQKEDITIISHLTGALSKPKISFEFQLPDRSPLRGDPFIVKRLEDFKNDENEMNKQVASLLLFNSFIIGGQNFLSGESILAQATSSIGGIVSGWLTNLFNKELLKATNGIISTYIDINPAVNLQLSQLQANVKAGVKIFLSNRIYFLIGGNLDYNNPYTQLNKKGLLTPDITIEWLLNNDGSLRVVGFNRTSIDITTGQRNRSGIQLSYRKDFNKLSDIFKSKRKMEKEEQELFNTKLKLVPR
ncbi:MAG: translocation/assembly module TamB domain-containing protein [Ferruginibacter sp.]